METVRSVPGETGGFIVIQPIISVTDGEIKAREGWNLP